MAVDRQLVARTVGELGATSPQAGELLVGLGRVVEATRTVVGADGTGLTLAHEDGRPRWVAVSDAAMELLEQVQHDLGEGPCLAAFAEDRVVAVEDLGSERVWDRLAGVVGQLQVRGGAECAGAAGRPAGRDSGCVCQPAAAWTPGEVEALGGAGGGDRGAGQHRGRAGGPGAGGGSAAAGADQQGLDRAGQGGAGRHPGGQPEAAFQQLRRRARSSSRKVADLAQEVVQEAQRERVAALAVDDARVRAAEGGPGRLSRRCRRPGPGWPDAPRLWTGPRTTPTPASGPPTSATTSPTSATGRYERNHLADERERAADERDRAARDSE